MSPKHIFLSFKQRNHLLIKEPNMVGLFLLSCDCLVVWATMTGNECFMITIYIYIYIYICNICICTYTFHKHLWFTGQQRKKEAISLTPLFLFHPLQRHLDISRAITAESLPLPIASIWIRTGNLSLLTTSH